MNRFSLKTILLSVVGVFLTCTVLSNQINIPDNEMPDGYIGIVIEEESSTNPHRSLTPEIEAYYYMKEVVLEMNMSLENTTVEIINTSTGMMKKEILETKDYNASISISEMGVGNYLIYITLNANLKYIGTLELY